MSFSLKMYVLTGYVWDYSQKWCLPRFRASLSGAEARFRRVFGKCLVFAPRFQRLAAGFEHVFGNASFSPRFQRWLPGFGAFSEMPRFRASLLRTHLLTVFILPRFRLVFDHQAQIAQIAECLAFVTVSQEHSHSLTLKVVAIACSVSPVLRLRRLLLGSPGPARRRARAAGPLAAPVSPPPSERRNTSESAHFGPCTLRPHAAGLPSTPHIPRVGCPPRSLARSRPP